MMKKYLVVLLLIFLPEKVLAQASRQPIKRLNFSYQYYRIEKETTLNSVNFLSRSGGYLDYSLTQRLSTSWDWYYDLGAGINLFETNEAQTLKKNFYIPYHAGFGIKFRFGRIKTLRWVLGLEGASQAFANSNNLGEHSIQQAYSGRVKSGFAINFMSLTGANAQLEGLLSFPVTPIYFDKENVRLLTTVDGNIRVKFHHRASWGLSGKVGFEDYETASGATSYFNTRVQLGVFFDMK